MTDIKTSIRLRQHEGWKETLEYIEYLEGCHLQLEKALGVARNTLNHAKQFISYLAPVNNIVREDIDTTLKEISDIMGGG